jgi:hypothetical protein
MDDLVVGDRRAREQHGDQNEGDPAHSLTPWRFEHLGSNTVNGQAISNPSTGVDRRPCRFAAHPTMERARESISRAGWVEGTSPVGPE